MENWANRKTLILGRSEMIGLLKPHEYNDCVEQAYRMHGEGRYYMDPKGHIVLDRFPGEWEAMPSYIEEPHAAACKWVSIREQQPREVQPADGLLDPHLHASRDGLSAGHRRRQLSHGDAHRRGRRSLGQMDGAQGFAQARHRRRRPHGRRRAGDLQRDFPWSEVRMWSRSQGTLDHFVKEQQPKYESFEIKPSTNLEQTVRGADVVVTLTPARGPIVMADWIAPGTHIAAVGADKKGDQELEGKLLKRARIFVDDIRQCRTDGEINVPLSEGLITEADIAGEIGEVITGKKKGRTSDEEITIFDSTGIALQDRRRCRSNMSAQWPPASASRRR